MDKLLDSNLTIRGAGADFFRRETDRPPIRGWRRCLVPGCGGVFVLGGHAWSLARQWEARAGGRIDEMAK